MAPADNDTQRAIGRIEGQLTGASKGSKPPPKPTFKMRPTGGLKPDGFKAKVEWKF